MKQLYSALIFLAACSGGTARLADEPILALDHVFVLVPAGGTEAWDALRDVGIVLDTQVVHHDGQGTSSVSAAFANAYLELLWVDSTVSLEPEHQEALERYRQGADWDGGGASPFGVGLRRTPTAGDDLPFASRPHTAVWMTPGTQIDVLAPPVVGHPSPIVFVVPRDMGFDAFREDIRRDAPELFAHQFAERQLTSVRIVTPTGADVEFFSGIDSLPGLSFAEGPAHLAELVLDNRSSGEMIDLRPRLPIIVWY